VANDQRQAQSQTDLQRLRLVQVQQVESASEREGNRHLQAKRLVELTRVGLMRQTGLKGAVEKPVASVLEEEAEGLTFFEPSE